MTRDPDGTYEDGKGTPTPSVTKWGGLKINKHADNTDKNPLSGAVFQVFDTQAKADACVTLVSDASGSLPAGCADAVSVSRDAAGDPINPAQDKFTTAADGTVTIPGLYIGKDTATSKTYYVVEIVPPAGYVNANAVYDVVVTPGTIANAVTEDVPNAQVPPTTLPMTGAQVSAFLAIAAVLLGGGAIALVVSGRRKAVRN
ncbi:SpaH/EbpB family LPXTG-anchored major pilin [Actinomycetaceae bacterium MB13-C1-2]|nr:SpaH/EbpB family LPXTG-anchored major pilin [Actinomycetaceae bacterium MB13-C1-2]